MSYLAKNISEGYAILLKHQLAPGESLDLQEAFKGFCKPKKVTSAGQAKYVEYKETEFSKFLDKVKTEWARDKAIWQIIEPPRVGLAPEGKAEVVVEDIPTEEPEMAPAPAKTVKARKRTELLTAKKSLRKISDKGLDPKELAWLPFNDDTKKIINGCVDTKRLKAAYKLVRNLAGQERTRTLIERRLTDLLIESVE